MSDWFSEQYLTKKYLLLTVSAIAALFIFLAGLAGTVLLPQTSLTPELVGAVAVSDQGLVIVDCSHTRMLFLNAERQLVKVVKLDSVDVPFDLAHHVAVVGDKVYVLGLRMRKQGVTIGGETLLRYDLSGRLQEEIYHEDYSDGEYVQIPRFTNLCATAERLSLVKLLPGAVERLQFAPGEKEPRRTVIAPELEETLRLAYYVEDNGDMLLLSTAGWYYYYNHETGGFSRLEHAAGRADILSILRLPAVAAKQIFKDNFIPHPSMLAVDQLRGQSFHVNSAHELNAYYLADGTDLPVRDIPLAPRYLLEIGLFWLAAAWLAVLTGFGGWKLLRYLWQEESSRQLLSTGLVMVVLAAGIAGYYTRSSHQVINESYDYFIQVQFRQLKMLLERDFPAVLAKVEAVGGLEYLQDRANRVEIHELQEFLVNYIRACGDGTGYYTELNVLGRDGNYYSLADSSRREITGDVIYRQEDIPPPEAFQPEAVVQDINYYGEVRFIPGFFFTEQQQPVAQFEIGYLVPHLAQKQQQFALMTFFNLLAAMIGLYALYRTGRLLRTMLERYRPAKAAGEASAPLQLYPLLGFLIMLSSRLDVMIYVFNIAALCDGSLAAVAKYSALSVLAKNTGQLAGSFLLPLLQQRCRTLRLGCLLSAASALSFAGLVAAVLLVNIQLFLGVKLVQGFFQSGLLENWFRSLPQLLPAADRKPLLYEGQQAADIACMVSILAGGYLYKFFGFAVLFAIGGLIMVGLLGLLLTCFGSLAALSPLAAEDREAVTAVNRRTDWGVFTRRRLLVYILGFHLVFVLMFTDFVYVYPTVAANSGLSATMISSFAVFGLGLSLLFRDALNRLRQRLSSVAVLVLLGGVSFLTWGFFLANCTIAWVVVSYCIFSIIFDPSDFIVFVGEQAEQYGYDPTLTVSRMLALHSLALGLAPLLVNQLLADLSLGAAGGLFGLCCLLATILLSLNQKRPAAAAAAARVGK